MDNKNIFSENLKKYMEENNKTRKEVSDDLGISYYTFSDWINGKKYPRMDKIEMLADYFNISKSDLIENDDMDEGSPIIGKIMRHVRKTKNISLEEFSNDMGIEVSDLDKYESGKAKIPQTVLKVFADHYGTDIDDILATTLTNEAANMRIALFANNPEVMKRAETWFAHLEKNQLTEEELDKLYDYFQYILYKRNK